jgi:glycosyltransferase involved in cell wall biosynthesis
LTGRRPRVAIVLPPGEAFSPGAAGALALLARRHAQHRGVFDATVLGLPPPTPPFADVTFAAVAPRHWWRSRLPRYGAGVAATIRDLAPDLIEVHNSPIVALTLAARCAPLPVTLILNNDPQAMRRAARVGQRTRLLRGLAGVACSSAYLVGRLCEGVGDVPDPPILLPNCLDLAEVPPPSVAREKLILFAGRVVADKGADGFVAACALALPDLPGWRAEMIGGDRFGPDNPETSFLHALRPRAAAAGVAMLGYRPHAEVLAAMARAAIVVVPSRWPEPFGLTALEAMACGAALLCSNRGGLAEVTGEAAVPVDPDATGAFAAAIVAVASDPARQAALGCAGLARAKAFGLGVIGPRLDAWRLSACGALPRTPPGAEPLEPIP